MRYGCTSLYILRHKGVQDRASRVALATMFFLYGCAQLPINRREKPSSSAITITHEIVHLELEGNSKLPQSLAALDTLIAEELADLKQLPVPSDERGRAMQLFQTMDALLIRHNYVFPPAGLVDYVSDTFVDHHPSDDDVGKIEGRSPNSRRLGRIQAAFKANEAFHYVDCDTGAMLYIAVAEELKYPCRLVEIPGHNFVRWDSPSLKLNWDANYGASFPDSDYKSLAHVSDTELASVPYLRSMTHDQVIGYWYSLRGRVNERQKHYGDALRDFQKSVALSPASPDNINELAWLLASCADSKVRNGALAIRWAQRALAMFEDPEWVDTLAAAYAEVHQWDMAVATEQKAKKLSENFLRSKFISDPPTDYSLYVRVYENHQTYAEYQSTPKGSKQDPANRLPKAKGHSHERPETNAVPG